MPPDKKDNKELFYFLVMWFATLSVPQYIMLIRLPSYTHNSIKFFLNAEGSFNCFYFMFTRMSIFKVKFTYIFFNLMQIVLADSCHYNVCPIDTVKTIYSRITFLNIIRTFFGHKELVLYTCLAQRNFPRLKTFLLMLS